MSSAERNAIEEGHALIGQGDFARAYEVLSAALASGHGDDAELLYLAGSIALALGDIDAARRLLKRSLEIAPTRPEALHDLGLVELELGSLEQARTLLSDAVERDPDNVGMRHTLALALDRLGAREASARHFRRILEQVADFVPAKINFANLQARTGELAAAEELLNEVLAVDPNHTEALHNLGYLLRTADRVGEAEEALRRALKRTPESVETLDLLSLVLSDQGRYDEAERVCRQALRFDATAVSTLNNLALSLIAQNRCDEATPFIAEALRAVPEDPASHHNLSYLAFCLGDHATGWREYEWSFAAGVRTPDRRFDVPRWRGPDDENRRVLTWREQGLGDEIMFAGCFPDLMASVDKMAIECDVRLVDLFARSFPEAEVFGEHAAPAGSFDAHVPQGSLGGCFRTSPEAYPRKAYLTCDPEKVEKWRDRLSAEGIRPKIGISWTSGLLNNERRLWFASLDAWAPVLRRKDIDFVTLQYGDQEADIMAAEARYGIRILRWPDLDLTNGIDDLAALSHCLDGAVGASGAAMTLASAVGTPIVQVRKDPEPAFYACFLADCSVVRMPWTMSWTDAVEAVNAELDGLLARVGARRNGV